MSDQPNRRNTRALEPALITDPIELAKAEARNGLKQYDAGVQAAQSAIERGRLQAAAILDMLAAPGSARWLEFICREF